MHTPDEVQISVYHGSRRQPNPILLGSIGGKLDCYERVPPLLTGASSRHDSGNITTRLGPSVMLDDTLCDLHINYILVTI